MKNIHSTILCFRLFLITIVKVVNGSLMISDWFESRQNLNIEEEREVATKFINMMEIFLQFAQLALQMNTKVDEMMRNEDTVIVFEIEELLSSCSEIKNFFMEIKSEFEQGLDGMNLEKLALYDDLVTKFVKLAGSWTEMQSKMLKLSVESKDGMVELSNSLTKAMELIDRIHSSSQGLGFHVRINVVESAGMDGSTIKTKGKAMVKMATLLITYFKRLQATVDKLESLGYYVDSDSMPDREIQESIDAQLEIMETTRKYLLTLLVESNGALGLLNLLSYAMETIQYTNNKIPLLDQRIKERHERAMKNLGLVADAYQELSKYIPRSFDSSRDEL